MKLWLNKQNLLSNVFGSNSHSAVPSRSAQMTYLKLGQVLQTSNLLFLKRLSVFSGKRHTYILEKT